MNIKFLGTSLLVMMLSVFHAYGQDFSNKGKEFWLAYSFHVGMASNPGNQPIMTLYLTSDQTTTYTVEIFGVTTIQTGTINANQVVTLNIPNSYFIDNEGQFSNKAIRVTSVKPIVVYSYITRSAASGATLCLPVNVLGRDYVSANFTQSSNEPNSNSYFTIVAVEDNTTVEITPSGATKNGWLANQAYTVSLNKGQIYQVLGALNPPANTTGVDLTGSKIRSISSGTGGCKRIAVFSGSGKIRIPASGCSNSSSDNLYQQLYPTGSWGKKYLTVPSNNHPNNYYRILINDPSSVVKLNGVIIPTSNFINGIYYQFINNIPNVIESDKPVSVVQYFTTQGCDGNPNQSYDPDMIVLNPVEQNINRVTLVNSNLFANPSAQFPHQHHIQVVMRNNGTGISSFVFDGTPVPATSWVTHSADPSYSYLYLSNVSQGYHTISSDSGFNALAYGYANAESYGYSAGANVKDLYQFVSIQNQLGTVPFPAACRNSPFYFSMVFPYQPTQIQWDFGGLFPNIIVNSPVFDSSWNINGKQVYRYKIPAPYIIPNIGTYPIKVIAQNPTADGCSGVQEINYELQVFERPSANFNFQSTGCLSDNVFFNDTSNTNGRPAIIWNYDFGDNNTATIKNPVHVYSSAGSYNVKYSVVTDIGCVSDTITKTMVVAPRPEAKFGISTPACTGKQLSFTDSSSVSGSALVKWTWNFGDGSPDLLASTNVTQQKTYAAAGVYTITLKVESVTGCQSTIFSRTITIHPDPVADFNFGTACLPGGTLNFTNNSSISDGSALNYSWNFGNNTFSNLASPAATYSATGPFSVKLVVTSLTGCTDSMVKQVNTIYARPAAAFTAPMEICLGSTASFTDQSTATGSTVTQWQWKFGDGQGENIANPVHLYSTPGTYTVTLAVTSAIGCISDTLSKTIIVNPLPAANFSFTATQCAGQAISFSDASMANAGSIVKWTWNMGDGSPATVRTSNTPFSYIYTSPGTYQVSLIVETNKGCISQVFNSTVQVRPVPVPGFMMPENCLDDPFSQFLDTSSIADGSQGSFTYVWNFGDPNASGTNPNTSSLKDPKHKYTAVGPYMVTLTVTSAHGCSATVSQSFFVNGTQPVSAFTINNGNQQCSNTPVSITNNSLVDVGTISKLTIQWDYLNTPSSIEVIDLPVPGAVLDHSYPEFFTPATKEYTIRMIAYSGDSCFQESTKVITMKATPEINFTVLPSLCADADAITLNQATVTNIPGTGVYSGPGINGTTFSPSAAGTGVHIIRYTFIGNNGCTNFKEMSITVFPVPTVDAGPDKFVLEGGNAVLQATANGNIVSYTWTPVNYLNDASISQPLTTPADDINYTLTVTSADGCSASDNVFVKLLKAPSIPNVFTPNKDGINDVWEIKYLESYPGAVIDIFNRYGQKVFSSVGYSKPWDGSFKGSQVPAGTYYYIINPKNGRNQMSGFVDVVR